MITPFALPLRNTHRIRLPVYQEATIELPTLAVGVAIYAGFMTLTWFFDSLPWAISFPVASILLAWHSSFPHEAIHGHPSRSRALNTAFGCAPLALWLPYEAYRDTHLRHHRCKGVRLT